MEENVKLFWSNSRILILYGIEISIIFSECLSFWHTFFSLRSAQNYNSDFKGQVGETWISRFCIRMRMLKCSIKTIEGTIEFDERKHITNLNRHFLQNNWCWKHASIFQYHAYRHTFHVVAVYENGN